ncbi:baeRF2 domain-containing protein [Cryobacterium tepidiphilum]|nr:Vms1/Ankzf1 family peptidyl-tRNA hydrolase [Cryobacterium tepidiphilum]
MTELGNEMLSDLYRHDGAVSTLYVALTPDTTDPRHTQTQRRAARQAMLDAGSPEADAAAVESLLEDQPGVANPVSRYLIVRNGEVVVDELLLGEPLAERIAAYGLPSAIPLLRHRPRELSYAVVEVNREEAEIRLYRLNQLEPVMERDIQGDDEYTQKVKVGGWSQKRYQRDAEQIWKRNEGQVAEAVDDIVREHKVELVLVAGDMRACQLLADQLAPASRDLAVVVPTNTLAGGASDEALEEELHKQIVAVLARDQTDALDRLAAESGRDDGLAEVGIGPVVHALQQAQVDTLILDPAGLGDKTLLALAAEPWIATAPEDALGAPSLGAVPAADALVRAAVLSDSTVVLVETDRGAPGTPLDDTGGSPALGATIGANHHVAAVLRWRTGPATPGSATPGSAA